MYKGGEFKGKMYPKKFTNTFLMARYMNVFCNIYMHAAKGKWKRISQDKDWIHTNKEKVKLFCGIITARHCAEI
jgi:hypothetical protein